MGERGVGDDHSTIYRWVQKYAPEIEKRLRRQWRCPRSTSWRADETYVKVCGKWAYLYRALGVPEDHATVAISATLPHAVIDAGLAVTVVVVPATTGAPEATVTVTALELDAASSVVAP